MKAIVLQSGKSMVARLEAAGQVVFTAHYYDSQEENIDEIVGVGEIESDVYVTIVPAPTGKRVVKEATFYNAGGGDATLVLAIDDGTNQHIMYRVLVGSGGAIILSQLGDDVTTIPGLPGDTGANPEFRVHDGWVQWRLADQEPEEDWENLYELPEDGGDGANVELREHEGYVQWRLADQTPEGTWENLFEVPTGKEVEMRYHEGEVQWRYADQDPADTWKKVVDQFEHWFGTPAQYEAVDPKDNNTIYFVELTI